MSTVSPDTPSYLQPYKRIIKSLTRRPTLRNLLGFCLFEFAFYAAYRFGMSFSPTTASPFWFPDSVLLCALLLTRPRGWLLLLLATLPIRLLVAVPPDTPDWFLLATFTIDCSKTAFAATLLRQFSKDPIRFDSIRTLGLYFAVVVLLTPAISAFAGAAARHSLGSAYWMSWEQWFYGDALAGLIITPFAFYWVLRPPSYAAGRLGLRWLEAAGLTCGLVVTTSLAFGAGSEKLGFADSRFYAPIPFLFWAAIRFGMFGASGAALLLAIIAVVAALIGRGPFSGASPSDTAANLQYFLLLRAAPLYVVAVLIEHAKRVEHSLRESEKRFRYLADNAPILIWMSGTNGLCDFFNEGWLAFTGRTLQQELGNGWVEGVHPEDRSRCLSIYESSFESRISFEMDYRLRNREGKYRWIHDKGVPRYALHGDFLGYIGSVTDVNDRREQEATLRASEAQYRELVESQTDLVCRFLPDMTLTFVNQAYCRFFGCDPKDAIGAVFLDHLPEHTRTLARERITLAKSSDQSVSWEGETVRRDGSHRWQNWSCRGVFEDHGELRELQVIGHDLTDRKYAEEAGRQLSHHARLAALGELSAMIAHEINQPLCAILSNAEAGEALLQSEHPPLNELRQIFVDICKDDLRADGAIRRIRALMQKREMRLEPQNLNSIVTEVLHLVAGDAIMRKVKVRTEFQDPLPFVGADRVYLEQVLLNLIANGMDAMSETAEADRQLVVRTLAIDDETIQVSVTDYGRGIPKERIPRLFDSFFTTKPDGMGLGLSIAKSIIQAHHGNIWAENGHAAGAILHFTVRAVRPATAAAGR